MTALRIKQTALPTAKHYAFVAIKQFRAAAVALLQQLALGSKAVLAVRSFANAKRLLMHLAAKPLKRLEAAAAVDGVPKRSMDTHQQIMKGWIIIGIAFGGFGTWAAFAPLAHGTHAVGHVSVESNSKLLQHLEGGIIKEILVKDGAQVKKGDVLVRFDDTRAKAQYDSLMSRLYESRAMEARLLAERDESENIEFPKELVAESAKNEDVARLLQDQLQLFEARKVETVSQVDILRQRLKQLSQQIDGMESEKKSNSEQVRLINEELVGLRKLLKQGFSSRTRVLALERMAADLEGTGGSLLSEIARAKVEIGKTKIELIQFKQTLRTQTLDQLRSVRSRIADINTQVNSARDTLARSEVKAPVDGQVVGLKVHTVGGVVAPGSTFATVVPENDKLVVEAQIQPIDIDTVRVGMEADIRFPGLPMRTAPLINGQITTVSGEALEDPRTGQTFYKAVITVPNEELAELDGVGLIPGMPAEVLIKAGERTALSYLVSPWVKVFREGMREE